MKTIKLKFSNGETAELRVIGEGLTACPICGWLWIDVLPYDHPDDPYAMGSEDICPCCDVQFGFEVWVPPDSPIGANAERWKYFRIKWLDKTGWVEENLRQLRDNLGMDTDALKKEFGR